MEKIRIGLACLYFPNFQAEEYKIHERSIAAMTTLAKLMDFELITNTGMVSTENQAIMAAAYFKKQKTDFLLLQASSLILGDIILPFAEASERIGFWIVPEPLPEGELPLNSLTGFNLGVSILRKKYPGRPVKWFYGSPDGDDPDFRKRLRTTAGALRCLKNLKGSRIGLVHDTVPTFINLTFDTEKLAENLGIEVVKIPLDAIFHRVENQNTAGEKETGNNASAARIEERMIEDAAVIKVPGTEIKKSSRISSSILDIAAEHHLDAAALRCWPEFQDVMKLAPCASISYLNDHGLITSCEGDLPGAVSMLASWYISREAPTMNDPVAIDRKKNLIQMWHCGPGPVSWADESGQTLDWHHTLNRRISEGENKAGLSSDISFKKGAVTLIHIAGDGSSVFVMEGMIVTGPAEPYAGSGGWIGNLTCNKQPCSAEDFLESITAYGFEHHYPIMRGHHEGVIREFASWAGIRVLGIQKAESYLQ